ncbi:MAG TPA: glutamine-hydrolyzing carbamoyl-phosphate synthase small subunit [Bdellovibrionota bacterium]|nr:glutamine-hydrolyzing carbamoyl-phosphate synthase small subunit [Bdellovibrionota bacterium]
MITRQAVLLLENGDFYSGTSCGKEGESFGEVVFNTSMCGYQEILTDPSYHEQLITMTYPHMGNYGTHPEDNESKKIWAKGFIVKDMCFKGSSWRNKKSLPQFLKEKEIVSISDIDTRKLTRTLRNEGAMRGVISTRTLNKKALMKKLLKYPSMEGRDLAHDVSCKKAYDVPAAGCENFFVVAFDFGIKKSILSYLSQKGCRIRVVSATAKAEEVLKLNPDGIFLSNGPGDPAAVTYAISTIKNLIWKKPVFGICLGHQLVCLALGEETYKLKFGHRGANHPVLFENSKKVEITSHNHGFAVRKSKNLSHINLNDQTVEGIFDQDKKLLSVQYHPESSPGPHDSLYLFDKFINMMRKA